jgi:hypothetical protein
MDFNLLTTLPGNLFRGAQGTMRSLSLAGNRFTMVPVRLAELPALTRLYVMASET